MHVFKILGTIKITREAVCLNNKKVEGGRLLQAVRAVAISPADAKKFVSEQKKQTQKGHPKASKARIAELTANKIVSRYTYLATTSGAMTALPGVIPGLGTAIAVGTAFGDATLCMKFQVDMCLCLAVAFDYDISNEDAYHLAFLIASGSALEKYGSAAATQIASKAGVKMLKQYLKGATLVAVREFFKKLGITFTRKALEKALPFGIGVVIGGGANYALTKYVGNQAKQWFIIDREES